MHDQEKWHFFMGDGLSFFPKRVSNPANFPSHHKIPQVSPPGSMTLFKTMLFLGAEDVFITEKVYI
jgi:hypothetical protein